MSTNVATIDAMGPRHAQALGIASTLTSWYRQRYQPGAANVTPEAVIQVLQGAKVKFVLMGTYGIEGYRTQARATQDVDVLVAKKDHRKAIRALTKAFPSLIVQDVWVVTRFTDPSTNEPVIDVMKPEQPVFKMVFKHTVAVEEGYLIPNLEMALVSKFAAMVSPNREYDKKLIDGGDFVNMVKKNLKAIDRATLRRLGEKVYHGGGKEIMQMVDDIAAGRRIEF